MLARHWPGRPDDDHHHNHRATISPLYLNEFRPSRRAFSYTSRPEAVHRPPCLPPLNKQTGRIENVARGKPIDFLGHRAGTTWSRAHARPAGNARGAPFVPVNRATATRRWKLGGRADGWTDSLGRPSTLKLDRSLTRPYGSASLPPTSLASAHPKWPLINSNEHRPRPLGRSRATRGPVTGAA